MMIKAIGYSMEMKNNKLVKQKTNRTHVMH